MIHFRFQFLFCFSLFKLFPSISLISIYFHVLHVLPFCTTPRFWVPSKDYPLMLTMSFSYTSQVSQLTLSSTVVTHQNHYRLHFATPQLKFVSFYVIHHKHIAPISDNIWKHMSVTWYNPPRSTLLNHIEVYSKNEIPPSSRSNFLSPPIQPLSRRLLFFWYLFMSFLIMYPAAYHLMAFSSRGLNFLNNFAFLLCCLHPVFLL